MDLNVTTLKDQDILWADYVFIGAMSIQKESTVEIIPRCNTLGRKVVAGGPLFTAWHDEFDSVHHLVINEAEITLPMFLRISKKDTHAISTQQPPGLTLRQRQYRSGI